MEKVGSKSDETLQVQSCSRRSLKIRPHCYGRTKLDMPALKPHSLNLLNVTYHLNIIKLSIQL